MGGPCENERPVIISCDGHATGRPEDYVPYIEPAYREQYDEFVRVLDAARVARAQATQEDRSLFSKAGADAFKAETGNARDGEWNSPLRTEVLEGEGVVAEVLFPNGGVPFGGFGESAQHELRGAGNRAYDRWLLDFANDAPGRRAALAMLTVHDLDATVAEITWARENGMKRCDHPDRPRRRAAALLRPVLRPACGPRARTTRCRCTSTAAAARRTTATTAPSACSSTRPRPCTSRTGRCGS